MRLDHVAVAVHSLDASLEIYRHLWDLRPIRWSRTSRTSSVRQCFRSATRTFS